MGEPRKCPYWRQVHPLNGARYHGQHCTTMYGCTKPSDWETQMRLEARLRRRQT